MPPSSTVNAHYSIVSIKNSHRPTHGQGGLTLYTYTYTYMYMYLYI